MNDSAAESCRGFHDPAALLALSLLQRQRACVECARRQAPSHKRANSHDNARRRADAQPPSLLISDPLFRSPVLDDLCHCLDCGALLCPRHSTWIKHSRQVGAKHGKQSCTSLFRVKGASREEARLWREDRCEPDFGGRFVKGDDAAVVTRHLATVAPSHNALVARAFVLAAAFAAVHSDRNACSLADLEALYDRPRVVAMLLQTTTPLPALILDTSMMVFARRPCLVERSVDSSPGCFDAPVTFGEIRQLCRTVARFLLRRLQPGDTVVLVGVVLLDFFICHWASIMAGLSSCVVPRGVDLGSIFHSFSANGKKVSAVFLPFAVDSQMIGSLEATTYSSLVRTACSQSPSHSTLLPIDEVADTASSRTKRSLESTAPCLFMTTSGTTGDPKVVSHSIQAVANQMRASVAQSAKEPSPAVGVCWSFSDLSGTLFQAVSGGQTYLCPNLSTIFPDIAAAAPSFLTTSPFLLNELQGACDENVKDLEEYGKRMFGGNLRQITVGGAPVAEPVLSHLKMCFPRAAVSILYGTSETGAIATNGRFRPLVEWRLRGFESLTPHDVPYPRGELLVKTPTSKTRTEEWIATGDLVELNGPTTFRMIGRTSSLQKLTTGEFIAPDKLESMFCCNGLMKTVFVEPTDTGCVALVVPRERDSRPSGLEEIHANIKHLGIIHNLRSVEIPLAIALCSEPWSVENGLLTATGKIRRGAVRARFGGELAQLKRLAASLSLGGSPVSPLRRENISSILAALTRLVGLPAEDIVDQRFCDLFPDWSSIVAVRVSAALARAGTEIPPSLLLGAQMTIRELADACRTSSNYRVVEFVDWEGELERATRVVTGYDRLPTMPSRGLCFSGKKSVLLTGASGFLGKFILRRLLEATERDIYCLARSQSSLPFEDHARVRVIRGELAEPRFALDPNIYGTLVSNVDTIIHCAAHVSALEPYSRLRAPNIDGVLCVMQLGSDIVHADPLHTSARILHISSAAVFNAHPAGVSVREDDKLHFTASLQSMDAYSKSKFVADKLALHFRKLAAGSTLEIAVLRPGFIGADTLTGEGNLTDYDSRWILSCHRMGHVPEVPEENDGLLDCTPVDFVAACVVDLCSQPGRSPCFHFQNPAGSTKLSLLLETIKRLDSEVSSVTPWSEWRACVQADENAPLFPLRDMLPEKSPPLRDGKRLDCRNTVEWFGEFPSISEEMVARHVTWCLSQESP